MNTTDNFSIEDRSSLVDLSVTELQRQLNESLKQLSPERLQVLADFAAFLANAESEAATQELLAISGLLERVKQNKATPKTHYVSWRNVRSDV
jgi:hypothetical protein